MNIFCLLLLFLFHKRSQCKLETYQGKDPIEFTSPIFSIKLIQNDVSFYPHVYYDKVNNTRYNCTQNQHFFPNGYNYYNRTISWIEFGQGINDTTLIEINCINNKSLFNDTIFPVNIFPLSYNINPIVNKNTFKSLSFNVTGNYKTLSVEFGNFSVGNKLSNYELSLLIFIGDISPKINTSKSNVIYFPPGVHTINNDTNKKGVLYINDSIDTIYFDRGAFVYGKIHDYVNTDKQQTRLNIIGYGILIGSAFEYCNRWDFNDTLSRSSMIESNRSVILHGLTVYNPSWFMMQNQLSPNSIIKSFKGIGWFANQDCCGIGSNGIIENSFCRTSDDSFKMETGINITIKNNVVWQLYNGDNIQMGWYGMGVTNSLVKDFDVIHTEWIGGNQRGTSVIGLVGVWNGNIDVIYNNITFENIRIDSSIGRVLGLFLQNVSKGLHEIMDITVKNVNSREKLAWMRLPSGGKYREADNFLTIESCNSSCIMSGIHFENVYINGTKIIQSNQTGWNLIETGQVIANVTYT